MKLFATGETKVVCCWYWILNTGVNFSICTSFMFVVTWKYENSASHWLKKGRLRRESFVFTEKIFISQIIKSHCLARTIPHRVYFTSSPYQHNTCWYISVRFTACFYSFSWLCNRLCCRINKLLLTKSLAKWRKLANFAKRIIVMLMNWAVNTSVSWCFIQNGHIKFSLCYFQ